MSARRHGPHDRERGAILLLTAILLPLLILMTAFAVDLGRQRAARRTMQARADVIALDLVRLIDGSQVASAINYSAALSASAARNHIDVAKITSVQYGTLNDATKKFVACSSCIPSAVKVRAEEDSDNFFAIGSGHVNRSAVATSTGYAGFQIGSKLVTVNASDAILLNGLVNQVLHSNLSLSAATYQGLAASSINLGELATQMGFASPSELAGARVNARQFYLASANVLQSHGYTAAASVFNQTALATNQQVTFPVGNLMQVDAGGANNPAAHAGVDAFNILEGSLYAINQDPSGNNSNAIAIPGMSLNIPNLSSTTITLTVIEGPRIKFGPKGAHISTQQASLTVTPTLSTPASIGGLLTVTGTLPLKEAVAGATGTLTDIACAGTKSISVGVTPQPVTVTSALNLTIRSLGIPIATVTTGLSAAPTGKSGGGQFLYTSQFLPPVGTGTMKSAPTSPLGLSNLLTVNSTQVTLLGVLPLGVTLNGLVSSLNTNLLNPMFGSLDSAITGPISHALGLDIGGADIGALDMSCQAPMLVG